MNATAPGPSLGGAIVVRGFALLPQAVASLRPHVDRLLVGIDGRAHPAVTRWARRRGVAHYTFRFTGFSAAFNEAADRLGTDAVFHLDADELLTPLAGSLLRPLAARMGRARVDAYATPRRHWWDLGRAREHKEPWPDWQCKLRRREVRFLWRVHQQVDPAARVARDWGPVVEHMNHALRSDADWTTVNAEYGAMLRADIAEGRVWTGDPAAVGAV